MEEEKDEPGIRNHTIRLRYGMDKPSVTDNAIMTERQPATVMKLTVHQVQKLERRYFFEGYTGDDEDIVIDLSKGDKEVQ